MTEIDGKATITLSSTAAPDKAPDGSTVAQEMEISKPLTFKGKRLIIDGRLLVLMRPRVHRA
ncbi:hypothetical protein NKI51_10755 [Mesorhizobium australicum]|uniref:hypothetical protein n=1 Tax=Mesorhizobium australicum TaxID=536018 RepID=UPI00333C6122